MEVLFHCFLITNRHFLRRAELNELENKGCVRSRYGYTQMLHVYIEARSVFRMHAFVVCPFFRSVLILG